MLTWLTKDVNQHDNCSNNVKYYPLYISNNSAIVEGVIATVFMLILYYSIYVAGWSAVFIPGDPHILSGCSSSS